MEKLRTLLENTKKENVKTMERTLGKSCLTKEFIFAAI